jgi:hypothetical protein
MRIFNSKSLAVTAILVLGVGLLVGLSFQQAPAQPESTNPLIAGAEIPTSEKQPELFKTVQFEPVEHQTQSPTLSNMDAGEPVYDAIPGAESIAMLAGPELLIVPADPNKPRPEQIEWRYVPVFRLAEARYDLDKRLLIAQIDSRLSEQTKARVYARLAQITGAPAQTAFRLNPIRFQTLIIELVVLDKKIVLRSENSGHDIANGPIPLLCRIKDDELHELLSTNLRNLSLTIRTTHPYAVFTRHTMQIESSITAARQALEKVLPKGMKLEDLEKHPLVVDRDSMLQLQQALREEFRIRVEGNPAKFVGLEKVLQKVLSRIEVHRLPLHELTNEITNNVVIWDSKTARLDVSPSERSTMTRELEEANEKRSAFKHAWDTMREEAKKATDHKTWHKTLLDKMKLDARLKLGIGIFSASASLNLEKEHNESDQGSDQVLRETYEKMKNSGEMSQENFEKSYRNFKGEDWAKSAAGKILNLQRVSNLNLLSFRSALLEHVERMNKGMLERVTLLPLEPSHTQQADALREIESLKKELETMMRLQKEQRKDIENRFDILEKKLSNSTLMILDIMALSNQYTNQNYQETENRITKIIGFLEKLSQTSIIGEPERKDPYVEHKALSDGVVIVYTGGNHHTFREVEIVAKTPEGNQIFARDSNQQNELYGGCTAIVPKGSTWIVNTKDLKGNISKATNNNVIVIFIPIRLPVTSNIN